MSRPMLTPEQQKEIQGQRDLYFMNKKARDNRTIETIKDLDNIIETLKKCRKRLEKTLQDINLKEISKFINQKIKTL